jgi:hypothetical protein
VKQSTNFTGVVTNVVQGAYRLQEMGLTRLDSVQSPAPFVSLDISLSDLFDNNISLPNSNIFSGFSSLGTLKLSWKKLLTVTAVAFRLLHTFTFPKLTSNEILSLLVGGVFQQLTSLETLFFYDTRLSSLEGVFRAVCRKLPHPPDDSQVSGEAYHNSCCEVLNSLSHLEDLDLLLNKLKYIH